MRLLVSVIFLVIFSLSVAQTPPVETNGQAGILLQQARAALGQQKLQSLSVKGKIARNLKYVEVSSPTAVKEKEKVLTSRIKIDFLFPDKFRIKQKVAQLNGYDYDFYSVVNGQEAWIYPQPPVPSTRENRRIVNADDAEKNLENQARTAKTNIARFLLLCLLEPLPEHPYEFSYLGKSASDNVLNDVLVVREADGFKTLLLLDPVTHLPNLLNQTVIAAPPLMVIPTGFGFDRRYNRSLFMKVREERQARQRPPQPISVQVRLSDRRTVAGLNLPHRLTTYHNGQMVEEIIFEEFKINQPINADKFNEKRPE